jgi:E3 ubiquitin-protein ligase NEDD4
LQSALDALPRNDADWRTTWRFKFEGEPGVDAGGVAREFWSMISAELFSPHAGLFKYSATDQLTYQINPLVTLSF